MDHSHVEEVRRKKDMVVHIHGKGVGTLPRGMDTRKEVVVRSSHFHKAEEVHLFLPGNSPHISKKEEEEAAPPSWLVRMDLVVAGSVLLAVVLCRENIHHFLSWMDRHCQYRCCLRPSQTEQNHMRKARGEEPYLHLADASKMMYPKIFSFLHFVVLMMCQISSST